MQLVVTVSYASLTDPHGPIGHKSRMIQKCIKVEMWSLMIQVCDGPKVISNDRMEFDDPKVKGKMEVWTLINQKSTVIPPSLMVLFVHAFIHLVS